MTTKQPLHDFITQPFTTPDEPPKLPPMRVFIVKRLLWSTNLQSSAVEEITVVAHSVETFNGVLVFYELRLVNESPIGIGQYMLRGFKEWLDFEEVLQLHVEPKSVN